MNRTEKNLKISKRIYFSAWLMEILAATIGVLIGLTFLLRIPEGNRDITAYLPVLGFFMIAIVELTRIPFSEVIYYKRKLIFVPVLLLMIFLNVETMFVSFNIYVNNVTKSATAYYYELQSLQNKNTLNEQSIEIANTTSSDEIKSELEFEINTINQFEKSEIEAIEKQINSLTAANPKVAKLQDEIKNNSLRIDDLKTKINERQNTINQNKGSLNKEKKDAINRITVDINNKKSERSKLGLFSGNKKKKLDDQIALLEKEKNKLNRQLTSGFATDDIIINSEKEIQKIQKENQEKNNQIVDLTYNENSKNGEIIKNLEIEKTKIAQKFNVQRNEIRKSFNLNKEKLDKQKENIAVYQNEIKNNSTTINDLKTKFIAEADKLPIYWIAKTITSKDSFDEITPKDIDFTVIVWFGTLSVVIASAGTALAFASFVMGDETTKKRNTSKTLLLKLIQIYRKPRIIMKKEIVEKEKLVETIKHVPEEKVIFKEVPKIQEVIKKEIVYVPVPTAREELIKNNKNDNKTN
ncbi:hypothetical protein OAQ96_01680 [Alphaproteobacteria bacterium]|nr:hypothetical protein [Alphaproteobacteria bacterium]